MLTKNQEQALQVLRWTYGYLEEIPVIWDPKNKRISLNTENHKWIVWKFSPITLLAYDHLRFNNTIVSKTWELTAFELLYVYHRTLLLYGIFNGIAWNISFKT